MPPKNIIHMAKSPIIQPIIPICISSFAGDLPATLVAAVEREPHLNAPGQAFAGVRYPRRICRTLRSRTVVAER